MVQNSSKVNEKGIFIINQVINIKNYPNYTTTIIIIIITTTIMIINLSEH